MQEVEGVPDSSQNSIQHDFVTCSSDLHQGAEVGAEAVGMLSWERVPHSVVTQIACPIASPDVLATQRVEARVWSERA